MHKYRLDIEKLTFLTLIKQQQTENIIDLLSDLDLFIKTLIDLTDDIHTRRETVKEYQKYMEIQSVKFSFHMSSLSYLIKGTPIKGELFNKDFKYPDLGSIYLLGRAAIENYLTFYYLNIQPVDIDEGNFKTLLYELSGLCSRQKYPTNSIVNEGKKKKESKEIEALKEKIKTNKFYLSLDSKKQKQLLSGSFSRIMGWEDLIKSSRLKTDFFLHTWKLYSNYAHSEMIGSIQLKEYFNNKKEFDTNIYNTSSLFLMLTCIMIKDLTKLFKSSEIFFNNLPISPKTKINFWENLGTKKLY